MTEATRRRLLDAGRRAFARQGLEGARVEAIAKAAGVNKALINYHFRGKLGLYREVLDEELAAASRDLAATLGREEDPLRRLAAWPQALAALLSARPELAPLLLGERLRGGEHLPGAERGPGEALLAATIAAGAQAGRLRAVEPAALQELLLGALLLAGLGEDRERTAALLAALIRGGLAVNGPQDSGIADAGG
jgi:TetR/AcrR family transcriptional regulator